MIKWNRNKMKKHNKSNDGSRNPSGNNKIIQSDTL
jgi:hypothetical protein